ncbi:hypothetical protein SESBI_39169 [Sesbania bispinosa]|nr:hypothetical protein SESBI_39169 [Sesbania bispinosa]
MKLSQTFNQLEIEKKRGEELNRVRKSWGETVLACGRSPLMSLDCMSYNI